MMDEIIVEIKPFLNEELKLTKIPRKRRKMICALIHLSRKFDSDRDYKESEINEILEMWHTFHDSATLRRLLYDLGFLDRDKAGSTYKLNQPSPTLDDFQAWIGGH